MMCPLCTEVEPKVECPHAKDARARETRVDTLVAENGRLKAERESLNKTIAIMSRELVQLYTQLHDLQWASTDALERERALKLDFAKAKTALDHVSGALVDAGACVGDALGFGDSVRQIASQRDALAREVA